MRVLENGWLGHLHAGAPLSVGGSLRHLGPAEFSGFANRVGEPVALELPVPGVGDFRVPALVVEAPDGSTVLGLRYASHRIIAGKPELPGLPSTYLEGPSEAETLEIDLRDDMTGLLVTVATHAVHGSARHRAIQGFRPPDACPRSAATPRPGPGVHLPCHDLVRVDDHSR